MAVSAGAGKVFTWFSNMTAIAGLVSWFGISLTYIRFYTGLKAQNINRKDFPFYSNLQPYAAWYALIACTLISLVSAGYDSDISTAIYWNYTVQWMVCFPEGKLGCRCLCHQLPPTCSFPSNVYRCQIRLQRTRQETRGNGLRH